MEYGGFVEQLVARKASKRMRFIQIGIAILAVLIIAIIAFIPGMLMWVPVIAAAVIFLAVIFIRRQNIEFEYCLSGTTLDVDKILAKSTRQHIASVDLKALEQFGEETHDLRNLKDTYQTVFDCTGGNGKVFSAVYLGDGDEGRCMLIFEPNERLLDAMRRVISPRIYR